MINKGWTCTSGRASSTNGHMALARLVAEEIVLTSLVRIDDPGSPRRDRSRRVAEPPRRRRRRSKAYQGRIVTCAERIGCCERRRRMSPTRSSTTH